MNLNVTWVGRLRMFLPFLKPFLAKGVTVNQYSALYWSWHISTVHHAELAISVMHDQIFKLKDYLIYEPWTRFQYLEAAERELKSVSLDTLNASRRQDAPVFNSRVLKLWKSLTQVVSLSPAKVISLHGPSDLPLKEASLGLGLRLIRPVLIKAAPHVLRRAVLKYGTWGLIYKLILNSAISGYIIMYGVLAVISIAILDVLIGGYE